MDYSLVEFYSKDSSSCGYCGSSDSSISHGLWAHTLTVTDYQAMIDRGWRRCGLYCYKPLMNETCCPAYTIRCDALNLVLSKSQKKVLRKFSAYLKKTDDSSTIEDPLLDLPDADNQTVCERKLLPEHKPKPLTSGERDASVSFSQPAAARAKIESNSDGSITQASDGAAKLGDGVGDLKPKCKKAKLIRLENRKRKLKLKGPTVFVKTPKTPEKLLEDYINESEQGAKKLTLTLVPSCHEKETLEECWRVYKKYQMFVHKDKENECTYSSFSDFLVSSPLKAYKDEDSPSVGYGSFHQLYRLNGKLIAVGVVDILPKCVSSVYFFYDPDFSNLSLGTYSSLRELALTRRLASESPALSNYYLGFYIHSCPKMKYKGRLQPSFLLCPEAYTWHPISECVGKIDATKYSRFDEDFRAKDGDVNINEVLILARRVVIPFEIFRKRNEVTSADEEMVKEYSRLVGKELSQKMFLRWQF